MSVFKTALEVNVTHHDIMTTNNYLPKRLRKNITML